MLTTKCKYCGESMLVLPWEAEERRCCFKCLLLQSKIETVEDMI